MKALLNSRVEICIKKKTLIITIFYTKHKGIAYKLRLTENAPPTFSIGKEGGAT
jgi:hypothetical protein